MPGCAIAAEDRAETVPGVLLEAAYVGDLWRNSRGGLGLGAFYLDNLDLMATVDGGRRFDGDGFTL